MDKTLSEYYDPEFYHQWLDGSVRSAKAILNILYRFYQPKSVIDIGCGVGSWLAVAESLGTEKLTGLDGSWVNTEELLSKNIEFTAIDFEKGVEIKEKYDLCICVEVAEHLPEAQSRSFVRTLCKASNVVLFSAAIKHQGGINHINEQWQSYWIQLFDGNGYDCLDMFRPAIWENEDVEWWYRENIFLFLRRESNLTNIRSLKMELGPIWNLVHPVNYESKFEMCLDSAKKLENFQNQIQYPTLRFCLGCIKRYFLNGIKRLTGSP